MVHRVRYIAVVLVVALLVTATGCGTASIVPDGPMAESVPDVPTTPTALLRALKIAYESRDREGLRSLFWDVQISEGESLTDADVARMLEGEVGGNFGIFPCALDEVLSRGDQQFRVPTGPALDLVDELAELDPELERVRREDASAFRAVWNSKGILLIVRLRHRYWLLFWEDIHALSNCVLPGPSLDAAVCVDALVREGPGCQHPPAEENVWTQYVPFQQLQPAYDLRIPCEVDTNLRAALAALSSYYEGHGQFPDDVPFSPTSVLSGVCEPQEWDSESFGSTAFRPHGQVRFAYAMNFDRQDRRWEIVAIGDPECDCQPSVFRFGGSVDANGLLFRRPGFEVLQ